MPETHEEMARETPRHVVVCDYIAGMTDQFLLRQHQEHFGCLPRCGPFYRAASPDRMKQLSGAGSMPIRRLLFLLVLAGLWSTTAHGRPQIPGP